MREQLNHMVKYLNDKLAGKPICESMGLRCRYLIRPFAGNI